jgi:hypothetical protein
VTLNELLRPYASDLSSQQQFDCMAAYDESPEGFARVCHMAQNGKNPVALLTSLIRKKKHLAAPERTVRQPGRYQHEDVKLADPEVRDRYLPEILEKLGRVDRAHALAGQTIPRPRSALDAALERTKERT